MTPPPTTINYLGIFGKDKAPVELIITFSSNGSPGNALGSLPVAIIVLAAWIVYELPSVPVTLLNYKCATL